MCRVNHGERMKGDVDLRSYGNAAPLEENRDTFERVLTVLQRRDMPPSNKPQPSLGEREQVIEL